VDWDNGNDPQYTKYIPVSTVDESKMLAALDQAGLQQASPCLCIDFPSNVDAPIVYWSGETRDPA
jgi:hypothetical protein